MTDVSLDAPVLASRASPAVGINVKISAAAATLLAVGTLALAATVSWRQGALYLVGGALGISTAAARTLALPEFAGITHWFNTATPLDRWTPRRPRRQRRPTSRR